MTLSKRGGNRSKSASKKADSAGPKVRYHFRVYIDPAHAKRDLTRLDQWIREAKIDEVMFFAPHFEETCPGLGTAAESERMADALRPAFEKLRKQGVTPSINIFWTMGFSNMPTLPRDRRAEFDFRAAVSVDGKTSVACYCPQDVRWLAFIGQMYATFAKLKPARLWIDDDTRPMLKADLFSPCFCEACLNSMTSRTGVKRDRAELIKAIMADSPNPVRDQFVAFQREIMHEIYRSLSAAVHAESPDTDMGMMVNIAEVHFAEGRRFDELFDAMKSKQPYCRPVIGPYTDTTSDELVETLCQARLSAAVIPSSVTAAPEIENYPFSRYRKAARTVRLNLLTAQMLGQNEVTLNVAPNVGNPAVYRDRTWIELLAEMKPRLQAIADLNIKRDQARGVSLYFHPDISKHVDGVGDQPKPVLMYRRRSWDAALSMFGIATRHGFGSPLVLTAELVACLSEAELTEAFSKGVLMDSRAAQKLIAMGKGELAGVKERLPNAPMVIETVEDSSFGGYSEEVFNVRYCGWAAQFELVPGARMISRLRDYQHRPTGHGVIVYENKLGGRAAIVPFDSQATTYQIGGIATTPLASASFVNFAQAAQIVALLDWLGSRPIPLYVPLAPCVTPLLIEQPDRTLVGLVNSHADAAPITLRMGTQALRKTAVKGVSLLDAKGRWKSLPAKISKPSRGAVTIETGMTLEAFDAAMLRID